MKSFFGPGGLPKGGRSTSTKMFQNLIHYEYIKFAKFHLDRFSSFREKVCHRRQNGGIMI